MMTIAYTSLFSIQLSHGYYDDSKFEDLIVSPSVQCQSILSKYGLLFRQRKDSIGVYFEKDSAQETLTPLKLSAEDSFKLTFLVQSNSKDFFGYTDLSMSFRHPKIFYWSNLIDNDGKDALYLTEDESSGEEDEIQYHSSIINISDTSESYTVKVVVKDVFDTELHTERVNVKEGQFELQLNLNGYPDGAYSVYIDGTKYNEYYISDTLNTSSLLGLIEIYLNDSVPSSNELFSEGSVAPKDYAIQFNVRETYWKYYVILKNIDSDPGFTISYSEPSDEEPYPDGVTFDAIEISEEEEEETDPVVETYGADRVLIFESSEALPFYARPKLGIGLNKPSTVSVMTEEESDEEEETSVIEVIKNLPNPSFRSLKPDKDSGNIYTEIFVYI